MDEQTFWDLISKLNWERTGDDEAVIEPTVKALSKLPVEDIFRFDDLLAEKLYQLDGEVFAREIGEESYCGDLEHFSVDYFLYVRCCVVANGKGFFESVVANPQLMPKGIDFEPLLSIAANAFETKTGDAEYSHSTPVSYETFSNARAWKEGR